MRRPVVVIMLLATVMAAMFAQGQIPARDEPSTLKESACYDCHSGGGGNLGPPLPLLFEIFPTSEVRLKANEPAVLEVGVSNAWVSELRDIVAVADLSAAPCLGFATDKQPISTPLKGEIETGSPDTARTSRHTITVESGASYLRIALTPTGQPASRMELHIWTPGMNPDFSDPFTTKDNLDASGAYVFDISGAEDIAGLGIGEWTVEAVIPPATQDPTAAAAQSYDLVIDQEFRVSGESRQFTGTADVLQSRVEEPNRLTYLGWLVTASCIPDAASTVPVEVVLVAFYDHPASLTQNDEWRFGKTFVFDVVTEGDTVILRPNSIAIEQPTVGSVFGWDNLSEVIGYLSAILIIASVYTGGMFGKASRRQLNAIFGTAKRRVAFHNFLSYGIVLAAIIHTVIFLVEAGYDWTLGLIWGGIAILAMFGLGFTGALQVPMIRHWNYAVWRWSHFYLSIGTIAFTLIHIFLDGVHFADFQEAIGWYNPLDRS
jgi:hypothetical protein